MSPIRQLLTSASLSMVVILASHLEAKKTGVEMLGSARFTVITPQLIRMEYAPDGRFIDVASWFARNRDVRDTDYQVQRSGQTLTLDTGTIHLVYTNDGQSFDGTNLYAEIKTANGTSSWKAGMEQTGNLGGIIRGLDRKRAAVPLDPGLLSRDGWYLLDDSTSVLASGDWFQERPDSSGTDWYFFGYGLNYKAALKSLMTISGQIPLPRKNVMGAWYSRNFLYTEDEFKQIVGEYHENDFPLDNIVMDYGWHIKGWTGYTWNSNLIPDPTGLLEWFHQQGPRHAQRSSGQQRAADGIDVRRFHEGDGTGRGVQADYSLRCRQQAFHGHLLAIHARPPHGAGRRFLVAGLGHAEDTEPAVAGRPRHAE